MTCPQRACAQPAPQLAGASPAPCTCRCWSSTAPSRGHQAGAGEGAGGAGTGRDLLVWHPQPTSGSGRGMPPARAGRGLAGPWLAAVLLPGSPGTSGSGLLLLPHPWPCPQTRPAASIATATWLCLRRSSEMSGLSTGCSFCCWDENFLCCSGGARGAGGAPCRAAPRGQWELCPRQLGSPRPWQQDPVGPGVPWWRICLSQPFAPVSAHPGAWLCVAAPRGQEDLPAAACRQQDPSPPAEGLGAKAEGLAVGADTSPPPPSPSPPAPAPHAPPPFCALSGRMSPEQGGAAVKQVPGLPGTAGTLCEGTAGTSLLPRTPGCWPPAPSSRPHISRGLWHWAVPASFTVPRLAPRRAMPPGAGLRAAPCSPAPCERVAVASAATSPGVHGMGHGGTWWRCLVGRGRRSAAPARSGADGRNEECSAAGSLHQFTAGLAGDPATERSFHGNVHRPLR